jgi:hypothetical protein
METAPASSGHGGCWHDVRLFVPYLDTGAALNAGGHRAVQAAAVVCRSGRPNKFGSRWTYDFPSVVDCNTGGARDCWQAETRPHR